MADPNPNEIAHEERAIEGYIGKTDTIALLLLGGVEAKTLKIWYGIGDEDIAKAEKKIRKLKGGDK